jgi:hypothetical protein
VDNINMDLKEIGQSYMDWLNLVQDRDRWRVLANITMKPCVE